jgi:hypothetical protein
MLAVETVDNKMEVISLLIAVVALSSLFLYHRLMHERRWKVFKELFGVFIGWFGIMSLVAFFSFAVLAAKYPEIEVVRLLPTKLVVAIPLCAILIASIQMGFRSHKDTQLINENRSQNKR